MIINEHGTGAIVKKAWEKGMVVPGFNIPYLPMMEPVVRALHDTGTFGLIMVARLGMDEIQIRKPEIYPG